MSSRGQFDDAECRGVSDELLGTESESSDEGRSETDEDEDYWGPECEDWHGETSDFTKKLNAARCGQPGSNPNPQQGTTKDTHVSIRE